MKQYKLSRAVTMSVAVASVLCGVLFTAPAATAAPAGEMGVLYDCPGQTGTNQQMSRSTALMRAQSWLSNPVPYNQSACKANQYGSYRTDCSGFVSMAWGASRSRTTRDIDQITHPIGWTELRPADAVNAFDNHVVMFVRWVDAAKTRMLIVEQAGGVGTQSREVNVATLQSGGYAPIRYDYIVEDELPADRTEGDVTGDGFADLTTVTAEGRLAVYGNGILTQENAGRPFKNLMWQTENTNWGAATRSVTTADVSGDRFADLVALTSAGRLEIYGNASKLGDGSPFTSAYKVYENWGNFTNVAAGDVNKDGWADLAATDKDGSLHLFLNTRNVAEPFTGPAWVYPTGWGADVLDIALGDVTGDAYADLAVTRTDGTLTVFGNGLLKPEFGGKPYVGPIWQAKTGWNLVYDITISQVTNDGDADLTAITTGGELQVYKNSGNPASPYTNAAWRYENWAGVQHIA
jgi:hypothetical protein